MWKQARANLHWFIGGGIALGAGLFSRFAPAFLEGSTLSMVRLGCVLVALLGFGLISIGIRRRLDRAENAELNLANSLISPENTTPACGQNPDPDRLPPHYQP